jgi:malonyl-CoA/methylmalonyl-CoA synthetase
MNNDNLYAALRAGFAPDLDATAVEACDTPAPLYYTWRDLERGSARIANLLEAIDIPPHSRVAVHADKSVEALMLYLAVLRTGHVYLPLNTAYQAAELEYFIGNAEPAVVVCAKRNFPWISKLAFAAGVKNVFTLDADRSGSLLDRAAQMGDEHAVVPRHADDLAAILYTSGTTGRSKGAMLTHGNLASNARVLKDYWGWQQNQDVLIHALPIFHVHGLFVASHGALIAGSKMLWFEKFEPKATIAAMARATVMMGVPTLYVRMLAEAALTKQATANMRLFVAGSAPLLPETFDAWRERTGQAIVERYGMSETVMLTSNAYHAKDGARIAGTVGKPLPGVQLRVHDDKGQPCRTGEIGIIEVKGPNVFKGYWRMPEKTAEEPQQGPDHQRRLQRLSGGDRELPQRAAGRGRECGRRRAAPRLRRRRDRGGGAQAGRGARCRRVDCRDERQDRCLQSAQARLRRARAAAQPDGQGAEEPAARAAQGVVRGLSRQALSAGSASSVPIHSASSGRRASISPHVAS